jgi:hypothetical protein
LALRMQERHDLFKKVFQSSWDESTQSWIVPTGWRFGLEQKARRFLRLESWSSPNIESLAHYLAATIVIQPIMDTSFRRLRLVHRDAEFGRTLLATIFLEADYLLRRKDMIKNHKDKQYLRKRLETESNNNSRAILFSMLEQQEQIGLLLDRGDTYSAAIVEPVRILRRKTKPNLVRVLIFPGIIGFFGAAAIISLVALFRAE